MACIYDDDHAVDSDGVIAVTKADAIQPPPFESCWYLSLVTLGGDISMRFVDEGARNEFYKRLVTEIK